MKVTVVSNHYVWYGKHPENLTVTLRLFSHEAYHLHFRSMQGSCVVYDVSDVGYDKDGFSDDVAFAYSLGYEVAVGEKSPLLFTFFRSSTYRYIMLFSVIKNTSPSAVFVWNILRS